MFIMNKTNKYNYVSNQVNIRIRIRIRDIRFASYPTISVSASELKYDKKCYPDPIILHAYSIRFHPVRQYCREGTGDAGSRALLVRRQEQKTSQEQGYSRGQPREMFARLVREYARLPKANPLLRGEEFG